VCPSSLVWSLLAATKCALSFVWPSKRLHNHFLLRCHQWPALPSARGNICATINGTGAWTPVPALTAVVSSTLLRTRPRPWPGHRRPHLPIPLVLTPDHRKPPWESHVPLRRPRMTTKPIPQGVSRRSSATESTSTWTLPNCSKTITHRQGRMTSTSPGGWHR
jgi:hypothetical protein